MASISGFKIIATHQGSTELNSLLLTSTHQGSTKIHSIEFSKLVITDINSPRLHQVLQTHYYSNQLTKAPPRYTPPSSPNSLLLTSTHQGPTKIHPTKFSELIITEIEGRQRDISLQGFDEIFGITVCQLVCWNWTKV